jgi:hypothetical protein
MEFKKASTLTETIQNFNAHEPLDPENKEEWEAFYVDTKRDEIDRITENFCANTQYKMLFGGHSGNGKSTELNKLPVNDRTKERYSIIKFDVRNLLDLNDIETADLFIVIFLKIVEFSDKNKIRTNSYFNKKLKEMAEFFRDELEIEEDSALAVKSTVGIEAETSAKANILLIKLAAKFYAKIRGQKETREKIRKKYNPRLTDFTNLLNDFLADLRKYNQKEILIIVDGLDKTYPPAAQKLFVTGGQYFNMLKNASFLSFYNPCLFNTLSLCKSDRIRYRRNRNT